MKKETVVVLITCDCCLAHYSISMTGQESVDQKLLDALWVRLGDEYFCVHCWKKFLRIANTLRMGIYVRMLAEKKGTNIPLDAPLLGKED